MVLCVSRTEIKYTGRISRKCAVPKRHCSHCRQAPRQESELASVSEKMIKRVRLRFGSRI